MKNSGVDEENFKIIKDEVFVASNFASDHPRLLDIVLALVAAVVVVALHLLWRFPCVPPSAWYDLSIASGLRPVAEFCPGAWRFIALQLFRNWPYETVIRTLRISGIVSAGVIAFFTYLIIREVLAVTIRQFKRRKSWRERVAPASSLVGAFLFSFSEGMWKAGQAFMPETLFTLEMTVALYLFAHFARTGKNWQLYLATLLLGLVSGESFIGVVATVGCILVYIVSVVDARAAGTSIADIHEDGTPIAIPATMWFFGMAGSIAISVKSFIETGGLEVYNWPPAAIPVRFVISYALTLINSASVMGWVAVGAVAVVPIVLVLRYLSSGLDEDSDTSAGVMIIMAVAFIFGISQLTLIPQCWYWSWSESVVVNSPELLCFTLFLSSLTCAYVLAIFGHNFNCLGDEKAELVKRGRNPFFISAVAIILLLSVPARYMGLRRSAMEVISDYVCEVARECGDNVKWIFTDGSLDDGIELASLERKHPVATMPLVSGISIRDDYIRTRLAKSDEEKVALKEGASSALKAWKSDFPENMAKSAIQIGFELWRRDHQQLPPCSGLLALPGGFADGERERGINAVNKLAERAIDICESGLFDNHADRHLNEQFIFVLWRISQIAKMRAVAADIDGKSELSIAETDFAERVEAVNPSLKELRAKIGKAGIRAIRQLSPRELLRQALNRADFTAAKPYADVILKNDPDNSDANFAIAMFYFVDELYSKSEVYFERCIKRRPDEPTFYNNLAIAQMMTRKYDKAEENAKKALELLPTSPEIKDTLRQIQKAKAEM